MIPSLDARLDSVMRAIQYVILPAIAMDRPMAIEQAHLVLAQLGIVRRQLDEATAFERQEAAEMMELGTALAATAAGGARTVAAAGALRAVLTTADLGSPAGARMATCQVGEAVEVLIEASLHDGDEAFRRGSLAQVVAAGAVAARRDRSWNQGCGFEAGDVVHSSWSEPPDGR